ncbi:MAG: ATP-binding cassette domain-containing protein [Flavobacteriales bacterium]|nr:ATP-binding cassette domain-containing protein [Flavobacteriales bacterium]
MAFAMEITFQHVGKRFGNELVAQDIDLQIGQGDRLAILGPNGSGKSTLLRLAGGFITPTIGTISYRLNGTAVPPELVYRHMSLAAPYLGLYEDLRLEEAIDLHARFKAFRSGVQAGDVPAIALLEQARHKAIRDLSSGMRQRLKLALAILSDTSLLLLDEPASNLDANGIAWTQELLKEHLDGRTLLIASNRQAEETVHCTSQYEVLPS